MGIRRSDKTEPMTWHRTNLGTVVVVCSSGHRSWVQHVVEPDGSLRAPTGASPSAHCGHCNENLPLRLDGWTDGRFDWRDAKPADVEPVKCDKCGKMQRFGLSGMTVCGLGTVCGECFDAIRSNPNG